MTMSKSVSYNHSFTILALYKFVHPAWDAEHVQQLRSELDLFLRKRSVVGNLLLSEEGINGTISYANEDNIGSTKETASNEKTKEGGEVFQYFLQRFPGIRTRVSYSDRNETGEQAMVFHRLRIRIKREIVTMGIPDMNPCVRVGTYVKPGPEWHRLLNDTENTLVIDTRNEYEVQLGTFQNAVNPGTASFTEFPDWFNSQIQSKQPKRIAMFCTGGIRCEKASSFCLSHQAVIDSGIPVYHLEGGILAYLDTIPQAESLWQGECYVFDKRTAVGHGLQPTREYTLCYACRHPLKTSDRQSVDFVQGVRCPYCSQVQDKISRRDRYQERQKQCQLSAHIPHIHDGKTARNQTATTTTHSFDNIE